MLFEKPRAFARRETRSYTDLVVSALVAQAEGTTSSRALATVEAACGLWSRAFASGESAVLTPLQLEQMGRALLTAGESVWLVQGTKLAALPCETWSITGKATDPKAWRYRLTIAGPSEVRTVSRSGADVFHVRINSGVIRPWEGRSPLLLADATVSILRELERSFASDAKSPVGTLIPVPSVENSGTLGSDIARLAGQAALVETTSAGYGEGRAAAPQSDWAPRRLGPAPDQTAAAIRQSVELSILAAAGVPPELVIAGSGSDAREAWRRFLHATVAPIGRLISSELERVGLVGGLSFASLGASDLAGRARAYSQLRKAEMPDAEARRICGFE